MGRARAECQVVRPLNSPSVFRVTTLAEAQKAALASVRYSSLWDTGWEYDPTFRTTVAQVQQGYVDGRIQTIEELEYELEEAIKWESR